LLRQRTFGELQSDGDGRAEPDEVILHLTPLNAQI
jgi:hypothetical protein